MQLGISVIICSFNSSRRLPQTLSNLAIQDVPASISWEVIVVDNASTDNTSDCAYRAWAGFKTNKPNLIVLRQPIPGKNYAYKLGAEHAKYEYILTCDDDNQLHSNYIAEVFKIMQSDPQIGVLGGCGIFKPEQPAWKEVDLYSSSYINGTQSWATTEHWVYGAGSTCRRSILMEFYNKGWHQITSGRTGSKLICGEDIEICFMFFLNGYKIIASDELKFDHFVPIKRQNLPYLLSLKYWISYSYVLLNNYLMLIDNDNRNPKKKLNTWFIASLKGAIRLRLKIARQKILLFKPANIDQQLCMKAYLGTLHSIFQNREKISEQYKELCGLIEFKQH